MKLFLKKFLKENENLIIKFFSFTKNPGFKNQDFFYFKMEVPTGFEPVIRVLQTLALPLGDGTKKSKANLIFFIF